MQQCVRLGTLYDLMGARGFMASAPVSCPCISDCMHDANFIVNRSIERDFQNERVYNLPYSYLPNTSLYTSSWHSR